MDIRRFGPGHRRPDGPPGTQGVTGQVIHNDERGSISELAFGRRAVITPHANPNHALFIVISGGGFVQVGDERSRVNHGEAVVWPARELHGAYTEGSEMRAIVVEFPEGSSPVILDGFATRSVGPGEGSTAAPGDSGLGEDVGGPQGGGSSRLAGSARAEGRLADRDRRREDHDETEGEPW
jgi:quercetin dioxygenase-like cupin family protein